MTYNEKIKNEFGNLFKKYNLTPAFSNHHTVRNLINNNKIDTDNSLKKSGIYAIDCMCGLRYIGQTQRSIETRFKEHKLNIKNRDITRSALAAHYVETGHDCRNSDIKLLKSSKDYNLNMLESIYMYLNKDILLNNDLSPINDNILLDILK